MTLASCRRSVRGGETASSFANQHLAVSHRHTKKSSRHGAVSAKGLLKQAVSSAKGGSKIGRIARITKVS